MSTTWTDFFKPWFEEIEQRSGGKVKIEAHLAGELVSLVDTYNAVLQHTVDMGFYFPMMNPGQFPMDAINTFWSYDVEVAQKGRVLWEIYKEIPEYQEQYKDVKLLWIGLSHSVGLATVSKPIRKLEDCQGLKFTTTGKWNGLREEALGLVPVSMPPEATVTSLQTGVLDGMGVSATGLRDLSWGPALKYLTVVNTSHATFSLMMNLDSWNKLPADIQGMLNDMAESKVDEFDTTMVRLQKERLASAPEEFGIEIIELSKEELSKWVAVDKPVLEAYAAELESMGLPGNKLVSEFLRLEKEYAVPRSPYLP